MDKNKDLDVDKIDKEILSLVSFRSRLEDKKVFDSYNRKFLVNLARDRIFLDYFKEFSEKVFKNKIMPSGFSLNKKKEPVERHINLVLSDLHFQSLLDPREVPIQYGPVEEARRLAAIIVQAVDYKPQYRNNTILNVHLLGDIIQGKLHDVQAAAPLAQQCAAAIYLLSQAISYLASKFPQVIVRTAVGNHGRNKSRHQDRAVDAKWDSIETIIYFALKQACSSLLNVSVDIPYSPYYSWESFGQKGMATHGDTCLNVGMPSKYINVESAKKQINEINSKLNIKERYSVFVTGHVHIGTVLHLPNGVILITNGCLVPPDPYALSIGIFNVSCGMWLWESVEKYIVGDHRFIYVDENTDKEKSLDNVIKPFKGF